MKGGARGEVAGASGETRERGFGASLETRRVKESDGRGAKKKSSEELGATSLFLSSFFFSPRQA